MRWRSFRGKLIAFTVIAVLVPSVLTMLVSYRYTSQSIKERAVVENSNLLFQGSENIRNYLEELNRSSLSVYSDPLFSHSLAFGFDNITSSSRQTATLQSLVGSNKDITQVYLYVDKKRQATLMSPVSLKRLSDVDNAVKARSRETAQLFIDPPHPSHTYGFTLPGAVLNEDIVLTLNRSILDIPSTERRGTLAFDVKLDSIARISTQLMNPEHERINLVNEDGLLVYSSDASAIGMPLALPELDQARLGQGREGYWERHNRIYIYQPVETSFSSWTLIKEIPSSYLTRDAGRAAVINVMLLAVSLAVIVTALIVISFRISRPINQLASYMTRIQTGDMQIAIRSDRQDEIGMLYNRFGSMMNTINNLILREYKLKLSSSVNQLRALQAQINPHFMNNTLQTIGTLALEGGARKVYALLSALSRMMRYSMYNADAPVRLEDELRHVRDYLELQSERFDRQFQVRFDIDESTHAVMLPKMIIQPLVENYFKHGMDASASGNELVIASRWTSSRHVRIVVEDNGQGIGGEELARLQRRLDRARIYEEAQLPDWQDEKEPGHSIGLANVLIRLKLFFGGEAGLAVESAGPQGCRVVLTLEVKEERHEGFNRR